jgi:predicted TIM-barrel fold metal-dependent hydrolase
VNLAGGYGYWRNVSVTLLAGLSVGEQDAILGGNARDFYGLTGH